ncbi:MAG: hypothetical protein IPN29_03385 [Saprospiraceae bacterium]|nr:hypothetical protein [Saprospiraceae bacterium]
MQPLDRLISWTMLVTGIFMVFFPLVWHHSINVVLMVFGIMGIIFATRDLRMYSDGEKLKERV